MAPVPIAQSLPAGQTVMIRFGRPGCLFRRSEAVMPRWIAAFVVAVTFFSALPAQAQWFSSSKCEQDWWQRYWAGWKENNKWPQQWVGYDRMAVCMPLDMMAEKGWHRQNLVGSFHFDQASNELNQSGQRKIRFILTQQLPDRRIIFVERGMTAEMTASRVDAVQQAAVAMLPAGELPEVVDSNMILEGWPANDIDATLKGYERTRPDPRLPAASSEASSAGESP
jgi:hypothetical protein